MTQKALYLKEGDRVCRDGFVFEYTQKKQDFANSVFFSLQNTHYRMTRNGYGAQGDTIHEPYLLDATTGVVAPDSLRTMNLDWNILQATPNPVVEERRILPEVECTYWEPNRPYLSGDIVCRFESLNYASGPVARQYKLTAYMCAYTSPKFFGDAPQYDGASFSEDPSYIHHAECSGPVWETQFNSIAATDEATDDLSLPAIWGV